MCIMVVTAENSKNLKLTFGLDQSCNSLNQ